MSLSSRVDIKAAKHCFFFHSLLHLLSQYKSFQQKVNFCQYKQCPHKESVVSTALPIKLLSVDEALFVLFWFSAFFMDFTFIINKLEKLLQSMSLQGVVFSGVKACNHLDNRSQTHMFNNPVCSTYFLY